MEQQFKKRAKNDSSIGKYVPKYQKIDLSKQLLFVILDGIIYICSTTTPYKFYCLRL